MNILITGGAGFIGSNLIQKLYPLGFNITVLDNLSPQIHGENPEKDSILFNSIKDKVNFIKGSVTNTQDWVKSLENQQIVVHLAAETGTGQSMYCIEKYNEVNILGTAKMLDILANQPHSVNKIVIASSRSIYGEGKYLHPELGVVYPGHRNFEDMKNGNFEVSYHDHQKLEMLPTDEDSKIHPSSVYGITKQVQEQLIMSVCPGINIQPVSLRYQNVYGPGQSLKNPYTGILSIFSTQIRNNNPINIFEDGMESRDFVFIDDVVQATYLAITEEKANNQIFNVGSGEATTVIDVAKELIKNYNIEVDLNISGQFRLGDIRHNKADLTKINSELGFTPKVKFEEGVSKFCQWVLNQKIEKDNLEHSLQEMKSKGLFN